jgi:hypothetical protein
MNAKTELLKAHEAMSSVLDAKLKDMPEWQAFRAIDRALIALESEQVPAPKRSVYQTLQKIAPMPSYVSLTMKALNERGRPITTPALMDFIGKHRALGDDPEKAKINVTSTLSKDDRFRSIPWKGGRAWWWSDKEVPIEEAGLLS